MHTPAASYLPLLQRTRHACLAASPDIFVTNEGLHEFRASLAPGRAYVVSPGRNLQLATAAVAATAITVATGVGGLILHAARAALLRLHHEQGRVVTGRPVVGIRHMVRVSHTKRVLLRGRVCTGVRHSNAVATSDRCTGGPKQELPQNAEICQHQLTIRNWHVTAGARSV